MLFMITGGERNFHNISITFIINLITWTQTQLVSHIYIYTYIFIHVHLYMSIYIYYSIQYLIFFSRDAFLNNNWQCRLVYALVFVVVYICLRLHQTEQSVYITGVNKWAGDTHKHSGNINT